MMNAGLKAFSPSFIALLSVAVAASVLCKPAVVFAEDVGKPRPNVLLIVADDMRPDCVAAFGNPHIRTPNLDRLASRGVSFSRAVCAYPICVSSRAELLTGCTAFRAQRPYATGPLDESLPLWPAVMKNAGYRTLHVGKWHTTGTPHERGYEATGGWYGSGGGKFALTHPNDWRGTPVTGYNGWVIKDDDGTPRPELGIGLTPNISEHFADAAIELLARSDERPFFLHVNFTAPHDPRFVPRGYERAADRGRPPVPENFAERHLFDHGNIDGRDEVLLPRPLTEEMIRDELAVYYALVEHLDAQVGRIVAQLEKQAALDDTLVIFTSDHGLALGSHGLTGKQNMYEHTINVPLIVAGPGIQGPSIAASQCYLRDLFPTVCELCGIEPPANIDGRSLKPLLAGRAAEIHPFVIGYFRDTQRMIRTDRWKLIRYPQIGREQLFDLENDPSELNDLSGRSNAAPVIDELRAKLDAWLTDHGDPAAGASRTDN